MYETLTPLLNQAVAHYLALDPETVQRLSTLSGKVVKIELTHWNQVIYLLPCATGMQIKKNHLGPVDTEIQGSAFDLLQLRFANSYNSTHLAKRLQIKGDLYLAQTLSQILQQIQIDWEELLARLSGDIVAHQIGSWMRGFKRWGSRTKHNLQTNITEYLQEESRHLPPREEVDDFFTEIACLQNDVARLEAELRSPPTLPPMDAQPISPPPPLKRSKTRRS